MPVPDKTHSKATTADPEAVLPADAIQRQIDRILSSPEFNATAAQKAFLKFVVETSLAGRAHEIKGYTIATRVFGRGADFNQATDPIVSIQANKLRRALERYYLVAGQNDPISIEMPKGTYVPHFRRTGHLDRAQPSRESPRTDTPLSQAWPTILVQPFENLTGNRELDYIGVGIATEIALEITRYQEIRVLKQSVATEQRRATDSGARFMLDGCIKTDATGLKVIVNLVDGSTGLHIWGDAHRADLDPSGLISFEENVANAVAGKISSEAGIIAKTLSPESRRVPPAELTTHQAILRFYRFLDDFSPERFLDTFQALQQACKNEPECGLAWSMLARLYALNYSLELFALETPIEDAAVFAEKGVSLDPANQRTRVLLAFVRLLTGDLPAGLAEVDRALQLNPNSLMFLENIGYLMTLFGDWQRGPVLIRNAISQNPYYNVTVHHALWLDWMQQEAYDRAFAETLQFRRATLFWDPLIRAATLGLLGKIEEGVEAGKDLLACKPDFPERGRKLIRHYIKFDDIVEKVLLGLGKVGIDVR